MGSIYTDPGHKLKCLKAVRGVAVSTGREVAMVMRHCETHPAREVSCVLFLSYPNEMEMGLVLLVGSSLKHLKHWKLNNTGPVVATAQQLRTEAVRVAGGMNGVGLGKDKGAQRPEMLLNTLQRTGQHPRRSPKCG